MTPPLPLSLPHTRPRIGITMDVGAPDEGRKTLELPADYVGAIVRAGGIPLLLAFTDDVAVREEMIGAIDGLLIPGGSDLNPAGYGQELHPKTKLVDAEREAFDFAMLGLAEKRGMPILGICLGSQTMNVHRGGTLHQHLPEARPESAIQHSIKGDRSNAHDVTISPGTQLAETLRLDRVATNSRHHQGFAELGKNLRAAAFAPDGLVEAFEDPALPFWMAVQWHPENLAGTVHERLFAALVKAAVTFRGGSR